MITIDTLLAEAHLNASEPVPPTPHEGPTTTAEIAPKAEVDIEPNLEALNTEATPTAEADVTTLESEVTPTAGTTAKAEAKPDTTKATPAVAEQDDAKAAPAAETTVEPDVVEASGFASLGLRTELLETLTKLGYDQPTPVQAETIPPLLTGRDLLGQAATGTGKTAAFALPVLNRIGPNAPAVPTVLVLVPTRELAIQVSEAMSGYGRKMGIKVMAVYGGQPISRQLHALHRGVHVVVATPGRARDHIKRRSMPLDKIQTVILDEADEMLDMGFTEDIEAILGETPAERQTVLFSATLPSRINRIARQHQHDPIRIQIAAGNTSDRDSLISQRVYVVKRFNKPAALGRILDVESPTSAIIFCGTRHEVDDLTVTMNNRGYRAEALHGGMDQQQRDRVMGRLRDGTAQLLVATDVAARGLDVDTLSHVVNYDVPSSPESYVHRIGRVGRAGREGVAITLAQPSDRNLVRNIERLTKKSLDVAKVPTVADLRTHRAKALIGRLQELLASDDLGHYEQVLDAMAAETDERLVAMAALKLADLASGTPTDEKDIPDASFGSKSNQGRKRGQGDDRNGRNGHNRGNNGSRSSHGDRGRNGSKGQHNGGDQTGTGFVYLGVGSRGGIRPGDLVGAIAGETDLAGRQIGPIRISDHFSVVGVPEESVDTVIRAVKSTTIKGKRAKARRFVD